MLQLLLGQHSQAAVPGTACLPQPAVHTCVASLQALALAAQAGELLAGVARVDSHQACAQLLARMRALASTLQVC